MVMRSQTGVDMIETRPKKLVKEVDNIQNMPLPLVIKQKNVPEVKVNKK